MDKMVTTARIISAGRDFPIVLFLQNGKPEMAPLTNQSYDSTAPLKERVIEKADQWDQKIVLTQFVRGKEKWIATNFLSILSEEAGKDIPTSWKNRKEIDYSQKGLKLSWEKGSLTLKNGTGHIIFEWNQTTVPLQWFISSLFNRDSYCYLGKFTEIATKLEGWKKVVANCAAIVEKELFQGLQETNWEQVIEEIHAQREIEVQQSLPPMKKTGTPPGSKAEVTTTTKGMPPSAKKQGAPPTKKENKDSDPEHKTKPGEWSNNKWKAYKKQYTEYFAATTA